MAGEDEFANDLSLDLLSEDDQGLTDDLIIDFDKIEGSTSTKEDGTDDKTDDKTGIKPSEKPEASESVASEDGKTTTSEKDKNSAESSLSDMSQLYSSLATTLHDTGVLSTLNSETPVKSADDLITAIQNEISSGLDTATKAYQEAMKAGVPEDRFIKYQRVMGQLDSITAEELNDDSDKAQALRRNIIRQNYLNDGYGKEEADTFANRSIELGEDKSDAKMFLPRMKQKVQENFSAEQEAKKAEEEDVNKSIESYIDKKKEIIPGVELSQAAKDKLFKQITTPMARDKKGNPVSIYGKALGDRSEEMRVVTEYLFMITDGYKDFSKLNAKVETKVSKKLDDLLKQSSSSFSQGDIGFTDDARTTYLAEDLDIDV